MANNKPIDKSYLVKQFKNYETEIIDKKYVAKDSVATTLEEEVTDEQVASALLAKTELDKKVDKTSIVTELSEESTDDEVVGALTTYNELQKLESANKEQFATASGNFITVNDSVDGNIVDLKLYGKSEQKQYTGKNLLDCSGLETATIYGVKFTPVYKNGMLQYINVNGTASNDIAFLVSNQFSLDNGIYKLSGCTNGSDSTYRLQLWRDGIGTIRVYNDDVQFDFKQVSNNVAIYIVNGATLSNVKFYPMIRLATIEDSTYEPYIGGIPSPSPDYPQEIKSVVNPVVKTCGKNLLNSTLQTTTINGVTCTNNGDGTYTLNGTATDLCLFNLGIFSLKKGTYRLVGCPKGGNTKIFYLDCRKNTTEQAFDAGDGGGVFTTDDEKNVPSKIIVQSGVTVNNLVFKPMITTDLTATYDDFEPYTEKTATLPYTLNAIPVESGGNVTIDGQQYIADYVDFEKKQLVRRVYRRTGDELKNLSWRGSSGHFWVYYQDSQFPFDNNINVLSSKLKGDTRDNVRNNVNDNTISAKDTEMMLYSTDVQSIDELNSLLDENFIVCAILITPETINLTNEEVQAFHNLATYYPTTNVSVSSDQLDGYAELKYPTTDVSGLVGRNESKIAELAKYTDDKFDDVNKSLSVIGKCKNLLNPTLKTTTINGITCTANGDGTYTLNGTATTGDTFFNLIPWSKIAVGKYIVVGCPIGGSKDGYHIEINAPKTTEINTYYQDIGNGVTFETYDKAENNIVIRIRVNPGTTVSNLVFKPMLTKDLTATYDDFVPYTGDGETLTHDVAKLKNDLDTLEYSEVAGGKNVFDLSKIDLINVEYRNSVYTNKITDSKTFFEAYIDYWNDNGFITSYADEMFGADAKGKYSITGKIIEGCTKIRFKHNGTTDDITFFITPISYFGLKVGDTFTISIDVDGYNPSTIGGLIVKNIQIEKGSSATPYEPYIPSVKMLAEDISAQNESLSFIRKRCINVLEHGIVGDGVTDNYDAIQNLINSADEGSTIFFPKGVYCISKGLVTSSKNINIIGERKGRYIANNDTPSAKFGSIIKYIGTEDATMLTQGASDWYLTMSNITFYSDSCKFKDNGLADNTIPYLQYTLELSDKVVNGIECIHGCQLTNVAVVGMSGYGIKPSQAQNIIECNIYSCRYGILQENNDLIIRNCYISASGTAIYCKGSKNLIASDCYMDLLTEYGIYCENYLSGNITDCYIDHSNYSAVCVKGASNNLNLDIYCGRNGIYYSGSAEEDIKNSTATTELSNMAMATAVCFNLMIESNIKIHAVKRPNDDAGTSSKKTPVFTLYIQQIKSGYIEGTQINEYIRQKANTVRPVIVNANGIIKSIYKSNEYTKVGVVKKTYTPQSTHMASQIGDMWIYGNKVYIATNITDAETTWTPITA